MNSYGTDSNPTRVCMVADRPGWAFDNIATKIKKRIGPGYEVDIIYLASYPEQYSLFRHLFLHRPEYHLIHFLWRGVLLQLFEHPVLLEMIEGMSETETDELFNRISTTAITTSVYDHMFLEPHGTALLMNRVFPHVIQYSVSSGILAEIYSRKPDIPAPSAVLSDGVDLTRFTPRNMDKAGAKEGPLRIGWAGHSGWGPHGQDHKGLHSVILPAIATLKEEGWQLEAAICDRTKNFLPHDQMPDFYRSLDIYVCASLSEGTPNPVLEAMACGIPILSTCVGVVPDAFGPKQSEFIVEDRKGLEFKEKLKLLVKDPDLRKQLSRENLSSIQAWDWERKLMEWRRFFQTALANKEKVESNGHRYRLKSMLWILLRNSKERKQFEETQNGLIANHLNHLHHLQAALRTKPYRLAARIQFLYNCTLTPLVKKLHSLRRSPPEL